MSARYRIQVEVEVLIAGTIADASTWAAAALTDPGTSVITSLTVEAVG